MKTKHLLILFILIGLFVSNLSISAQSSTPDSIPKIKIYYFHATNRCETCLACENICLETLQQEFQKELDQKVIVFRSINIDDEQNKPIAEQYKILFSTLLFVDQNGTITDLSDKAFENALEHPDLYKSAIRNEVLRILNQ